MNKIFISLSLLVAFLISNVDARDPGIVVAIRQPTIDAVKNILLPQVLSELQNLTIPDVSSEGFTISNITLTNIDIPAEQVNVDFNNGYISASSQNLSVDVSLHIGYSFLGLSISTDTTAHANSSLVSSDLEVYSSNTSYAIVNLTNTTIDITNLIIEINGSLGQIASLIVNLVTPLLQKQIDNTLSASLQTAAQKAIIQGLKSVSGYATIPSTPLGGAYVLSASPILTPDFISISLDGTFYDADQTFAYPPIPGPVPLPTIDNSTNENVQFFISDYVFNSAAYGLYIADYLQYTVVPSDIPSSSIIGLNTSTLSYLFPGLLTTYGPDHACQLVCAATDIPPSVGLNTTGLYGNLNGSCILQVQMGSSWENAFTVNSSIMFLVDVSVKNFTIYGSILTLDIAELVVSDSSIGPVNVDGINKIIQGLLELGIPILDKSILAGGFPLPSVPETNLESAEITLYEGYLKIGATPVFNPGLFEAPEQVALIA